MFYTKRDCKEIDRAPSKSSYNSARYASTTAKIVERFDLHEGYGYVKWDGNLWRAKSSSLSCWQVGEEVAVVSVGSDNILQVETLYMEQSRSGSSV